MMAAAAAVRECFFKQRLVVWLVLLAVFASTTRAQLAWGTCTPACQDSPTVTKEIDENSGTDTSVVTLAATGGTATYTYAITAALTSTSVTATAAFKIVGSELRVDSPALLDRETIEYVDVDVTATDSAATPATITKKLRIALKDVNELDPAITPSATYSPSIPESSAANALVQTVTVTDPDQAGTAVSCTITSGNTPDRFQMRAADPKVVELKTAIEPDSPTNDPLTYTLELTCTDNPSGTYSGGQRSSTATVSVTVTPVNDHTPVWGTFSPAYTSATTAITTIDENSATASLFTASATDADSGADGTVVYEIVSALLSDGSTDIAGRVSVVGSTGVVTLTSAATPVLDRETYSHFDIVVRARDSSTGTQRSIDRTVRVAIKDVNEVNPAFTPTSGEYSPTFVETEAANYAVQTVVVVDPDTAATPVVCSIVGGNTLDRFQMRADGKTVELKTQIEPDSPTNDPITYTLTLDCKDNIAGTYSGGIRTSTGTLSVSVQYNNDYSPVWGTFTPAWTSATAAVTTIIENKPEGETVFTAQATDRDASVDGVVVYILDTAVAENSETVTRAFEMNPTTGVVTIANSTVLDRENYGYVDVTVKARDSPTSGTTFTITRIVRVALSDYNEFYPAFTPIDGSYTAYLTDDVAAATSVQKITVLDPDYDNTTVVCSITNGNSLGKFRISSTDGHLIETAATIEPDKPDLNPSMYLLQIKCADMNNGTSGTPVRTSTAFVTVNMTLVNDNDPTVTLNGTTIEIAENTPVSTRIASVVPDDLDFGVDGTYTLTLDPATPFQLTGDNSRIFIGSALDREATAAYSLKVISVDNGTPARSVTATLSVTVTDVNDNTPVCTPTVHNVNVNENLASTLLASISCTDSDLGDNQLLHYSFISTDVANYTLSDTTGELKNWPMTYEAASPVKTIVIGVRDSATSAAERRTATVTVSLTVNPINDGTPVWATFSPAWTSATAAITNISESSEEGLAVFTAAATDSDTGPDGTLVYSLVSATASDGSTDLLTVFNVSASGLVSVKNSSLMDREAASAYTYVDIVVQVRDSPTTGTPNSIQRTVRVNIIDANEFEPRFTGEPYAATLAEDTAAGTAVQTLTVTDPDNSNTAVVCEITNGNDQSIFRKNAANSKIIELNKIIDPDKPNNHPTSYNLTVTCKDNNGGSGFLTAVTFLAVTVTTTNDNTPVINLPEGTAITLPETQPTGAIADIIADDNDVGADGTIACTIAPTGTFSLTGCTKLNLASGLDYPTASSYSLTITVTDSGATPKSSTVAVTVTVTDVNRHTPACTPTSHTAAVSETTSTFPAALTPAVTISCTDADGNGVYYKLDTPTAPFSVNNLTGVVQLTAAVDYDSSVQSYPLRVKAYDPADSSKTAVVTVTVSVTAVNEHTPTFTTATVQAFETMVNHTVVTTFAASDADFVPHAITAYSITSGNTGGMFSIDNNGVVTIAANMTLDYEAVSGSSPYSLTIEASDGGGLTGTGTLTVSVMDVNDRAPVFTGTPYSANVNEGTAADTTVLTAVATDADSAVNNNNVIVFRKGTGDASNYFSVDPSSGVIKTTANILNFDTVTAVNFNVLAIDGAGSGPHTTTTAVSITVVDVNNFAPSCTSYHRSINAIREDVATSTQVFSFASPRLCTDGDAKDTLSYTMSGSAGDAKFAVASGTGVVTVNAALNYEAATTHSFEIVVTDSAATPKSVTVTLTVNVVDVNEHQPSCTTAPGTAAVDEGSAVGTAVYSITGCSDTDTSSTAFTFSIVPGPPFTVSSAGVVSTASVLDLDPVSSATSYSVRVVVTDNAPSRDSLRSVTYTTAVTVNFANEFAPVLGQTYATAELPEDAGVNTPLVLMSVAGATVTLSATDADRGSNHAAITWQLVSGNTAGKFSLDANSGALTTAAALDREATGSYVLTVRARDGPGLLSTATATVSITVTDVNDNNPVCNPTTQTLTIYEGEVAKPIVDFGAAGRVTDADAGVNANLGFTLLNAAALSSEFNLTGTSLRTKRSFTAADPTAYNLEVVAADNGTPSRSATCSVSVNIVRTATPPTFTVADKNVTIAEDTATSTELFQFLGNLGVGGTGPLTMSLLAFTPSSNSALFAFDPATGKVTVNAALNYDSDATRGPFIMYIQLTDATPLTSTGTLTIMLTDVNDNDPAFGSSVQFSQSIDENVGAGFVLQRVTWTDADAGLNGLVNCSIFNQTEPQIFSVGASDCKLVTVLNPDRENVTQHTVVVQLTDMGSPAQRSAFAPFTITINDVNDNTPAFTSSFFSATVTEEAAAPQAVGTYAATDADAGDNARLSYSLEAVDADTQISSFAISATGVVTTTKALDREAVAAHVIRIVAVDHGVTRRTGSTTVAVEADDVNDHTPQFNNVPYNAKLVENATAATNVFTPSVTDLDSNFGTITYSIVAGNTNNAFAIATGTGAVTVASPVTLNRETTPMYSIVIKAEDNGSPAKTATVTLTVTVMDVNEHAPSYASPTVSFTMAENSPINSIVGTVAANDSDISQNIRYAIHDVPTGTAGHFDVESITGRIFVKQAVLDRETLSLYVLRIKAFDDGLPSLTSDPMLNVTINVTDTNDNDPVFGSSTYSATVNENAAAGTSLLTATATDADTGANAVRRFSIHPSFTAAASLFAINAVSGQLTVAAALDFETVSLHEFAIVVKDSGSMPQRSSTASVTVTVVNVNEHRPVFAQSFYNSEVPYDDNSQAVIETVSATDQDSGDFGSVQYRWNATNTFLYLRPSTGVIFRNSDTVMEQNRTYVQYAVAYDGGGLVSVPVTVRCDSFLPETYVVLIHTDLSDMNFDLQVSGLTASLNSTLQASHPGASVKFWKKQWYQSRYVGYFYALRSTDTDSMANLAKPKQLITKGELLAAWRADTSGTPAAVLLSTSFSSYRIALVEPYPDKVDSTPQSWLQQWWGQLALGLGGAVGLCLIGGLIFGAYSALSGTAAASSGGAAVGAATSSAAAGGAAAAKGTGAAAKAAGAAAPKAGAPKSYAPRTMQQRHIMPQKSLQKPQPPQRSQGTPRPDFNRQADQADSGRGSANSDLLVYEL